MLVLPAPSSLSSSMSTVNSRWSTMVGAAGSSAIPTEASPPLLLSLVVLLPLIQRAIGGGGLVDSEYISWEEEELRRRDKGKTRER